MPTAVEYAVVNHLPAQNGVGGGPPAQHSLVAQPEAPPALPSGDLATLASPLLVVAVLVVVGRRARRRRLT
ncbi:hypothetical protein [Actinophytocola oryzae]|uniref:Uncharacterized protein n=1 Tax=Actinophytocola oryzae TaxID=502181 RepID=A0A4R7UW05_9PSEU|nr:hypothetical protein [Actinophytocola oryzae]TDV40939.1 hypothetical protein CLV71_1215 [Actinophytocola oryzae]